jgi:hypothetical protein
MRILFATREFYITVSQRFSRKRYVSQFTKTRFTAMRKIWRKSARALSDKAGMAICAAWMQFLAHCEPVSHARKETFLEGDSVSRKYRPYI